MDDLNKLMKNLSIEEKNDLDELFTNLSLNDKEELLQVNDLSELLTKLTLNETVQNSDKAIKVINKLLQYLIILKNKVHCYEKVNIIVPQFVY